MWYVCYSCRARLAGQGEGGWRSERHSGQAPERLGQHAERYHGKGDAVFFSQSKLSLLSVQNCFLVLLHQMYFSPFFIIIMIIETDGVPRDKTEWCSGCQRRGSKTQDQDENIWKVPTVIFFAHYKKILYINTIILRLRDLKSIGADSCTFSVHLNAKWAVEQKPTLL